MALRKVILVLGFVLGSLSLAATSRADSCQVRLMACKLDCLNNTEDVNACNSGCECESLQCRGLSCFEPPAN